jgi:deazaflavin-dependent oxidoreductase (nitroreductase family)
MPVPPKRSPFRRGGVTRQTIIAIEQGRYSPTLEMAFQYSGDQGRPAGRRPRPPPHTTYDHQHTDRERTMTEPSKKSASLPPRWFIRTFWVVQRALYSVTRGRFGLRTATADHQGMMRLRTVGRRSGEERIAILAYFEDGQDLVTMAMNGWADAEPAWWLNLQAQPDVTVDLPGGSRAVQGRAADKDERPRLWARWAALDKDLDAFAARRSRETAVVILSPRPA